VPINDVVFDFESFVQKELGLNIGTGTDSNFLYGIMRIFSNDYGLGQGICRFFLRGACRKGSRCEYKHSQSYRRDKSVMCKHWLRGLCKKGENCEFSHEYNLKKMPECWFYSNYKECSNAECMYLHVDPESKVAECLWYNRGFCKHGPLCRNKHARKRVCQRFLTGFCPLGPACEEGHPKFEIPGKFVYDPSHPSNQLPQVKAQEPQQ
jgi:cleavage and polyadenylation specificity factor subunit 4